MLLSTTTTATMPARADIPVFKRCRTPSLVGCLSREELYSWSEWLGGTPRTGAGVPVWREGVACVLREVGLLSPSPLSKASYTPSSDTSSLIDLKKGPVKHVGGH